MTSFRLYFNRHIFFSLKTNLYLQKFQKDFWRWSSVKGNALWCFYQEESLLMHTISNIGIIVGNSKRVNLNMEVTRKQSTPSFPKNEHFILLDTHTYVFSRTYHTFSQEKLLFYNSPESFSGFLVSIAVVIIICFAKKETIHISAISKTPLSSIAVADFNKVTHYRSFDIPKKYFLYQLYS